MTDHAHDRAAIAAQMRADAAALGWNAAEIAGRLQIAERAVRRMLAGTADAPAPVPPWLSRVARGARAEPVPPGWFDDTPKKCIDRQVAAAYV